MILLLSVAFAARPDAIGSADSAHFRCHYETEAEQDRCDEVLGWAEEAYEAEVERIGFRPPPPDDGLGGSDAIDIYLTREAGGAGSAWVDCDGGDPDCIDPTPGDDRAESTSYVVIDPRTDDALFQSYVHHELCHTYQYATDYTEPFLSLWEGTAVACERWTDPTWPTLSDDFGDYQATPWLSTILQDGYFLADIGVNDDSWYEYGAVAWVWFIDETYGQGDGGTAPEVWEAASAPGATVLDAWEQLSGDYEASLLEFTAQRARMGGPGAPAWSEFAGEAARAAREAALSPGGRREPAWPPYPLGVSFFDVPAESEGLPLDFRGDEAVRWALLSIDADAWSELADGDPLAGGSTLAVVNLGPEGFAATDALEPASFSVRAGGACGCASGGGGGVGLWGLVLCVVAQRRQSVGSIRRPKMS